MESVRVRRSLRRTCWILLSSTQVESAAESRESNVVQLEPSESASEPHEAVVDLGPPVRAPMILYYSFILAIFIKEQ